MGVLEGAAWQRTKKRGIPCLTSQSLDQRYARRRPDYRWRLLWYCRAHRCRCGVGSCYGCGVAHLHFRLGCCSLYCLCGVSSLFGRGGQALNVSPLDVCSDRYHRVVEAGVARVEALRNYGIHADAGHIPPMPPASSGVSRPIPSTPTQSVVVNDGNKARKRAPVVLALVTLTTLFFVFLANYWVSRIPGVSFWGFWPVLLIVAGTTLLVCFADKAPLRLRLCGLVVCIELCIALLPFSLGICPPHSLGRLTDLSALIWLSVAACLIIACAFDRIDFLALGVGLIAVALVVSYLDIGVFDRLVAFSSYSHHNTALSLLRS